VVNSWSDLRAFSSQTLNNLSIVVFKSKEKFLNSAASDGFGFCSVVLSVQVRLSLPEPSQIPFYSGWDMHDMIYSRELLISNRANGYRDMIAAIDISTYRRIPWENNVPFFLVSFLYPDTKQPVIADPRGVLKITVDRAKAIGRECMAGIEYEASPLIGIANSSESEYCFFSTSISEVF
jgi:glutamine synthetase